MYGAGWAVTATPLDTCGTVRLDGANYDTFLKSSSLIGTVLVECYLYWSVNGFCTSGVCRARCCAVWVCRARCCAAWLLFSVGLNRLVRAGNPKPKGDIWYDAVATFLATSKAAAALEYEQLNITVSRCCSSSARVQYIGCALGSCVNADVYSQHWND